MAGHLDAVTGQVRTRSTVTIRRHHYQSSFPVNLFLATVRRWGNILEQGLIMYIYNFLGHLCRS